MFHLQCQVIESFSYPIQRFYHLFPRSLYFKSFIIFTVDFFSSPSGFKSAIILTDAGETRCLCNVWDEEIPKMLCEFFFLPFSGCWEGVYVGVSALSRQIFHSVLQVMFIKEFPNIAKDHQHWRSSLMTILAAFSIFFIFLSLGCYWAMFIQALIFSALGPCSCVSSVYSTLCCVTERAACPFQSCCDGVSLKFNTETTTCSPQLWNK